MPETSTPVLVLGSAHHGGLGIARSLGRLGVHVYVVDANPRTPVRSSVYCRGSFFWDIDRPSEEDSLEYLAGIGRRLNRRLILLPTSDTAALFVAANAGALQEWFIFPNLSFDLAQLLCSKKELYFLAKKVGVPTPNALFPDSKQDVLNFAQGAKFPIMLKAVDARYAKTHLRRCGVRRWENVVRPKVVHCEQELLENYEMLENPEHPNVMLQEYIPGGETANFMFNGYFNGDSECLFGITGKKIRQYPPYAGVTSFGVCLHEPTVAETTRKFMKTIGYRGILDIGYRLDARDGRYKVFDVNPRIGCTFRLFVSDNGTDVARAMYLDLTGQPVIAGQAVQGRKWMVEDKDLVSAFRYWRNDKLAIGEWLRSFHGLQECAFFALDDPRPVISACVYDFYEKLKQLCLS